MDAAFLHLEACRCVRPPWLSRALGIALRVCLLTVVILARPGEVGCAEDRGAWTTLEEGLETAEWDSSHHGVVDVGRITAVRFDAKRFAFRLLSASEHARERLTAREWCQRHQLVAAVNAGMYQQDGFTSVGFMKNYGHLNNPRLGRDNTVLAFNRVDASVPEVQIIDRECQDFSQVRPKYHSLIQGIRMISCDQRNVWTQRPQKWSTVAVGIDRQGRVLFLFGRSPASVHDFIDALLALPLALYNAMYLEGGPQASLYLTAAGHEMERSGSLEGAFGDAEGMLMAFPLPNVIGVLRKPK